MLKITRGKETNTKTNAMIITPGRTTILKITKGKETNTKANAMVITPIKLHKMPQVTYNLEPIYVSVVVIGDRSHQSF